MLFLSLLLLLRFCSSGMHAKWMASGICIKHVSSYSWISISPSLKGHHLTGIFSEWFCSLLSTAHAQLFFLLRCTVMHWKVSELFSTWHALLAKLTSLALYNKKSLSLLLDLSVAHAISLMCSLRETLVNLSIF